MQWRMCGEHCVNGTVLWFEGVVGVGDSVRLLNHGLLHGHAGILA